MRFSRNWIAAYTELPDGTVLHEAMSMLGLVVDDARPNGDDVTLDLDFPSNRPDAMNHWGVAREIALAADQDVLMPATEFAVADELDSADLVTVTLEDPACLRFVARVAVDVAVAPSPDWLCERLESIGLRPINNVVDITNFVMWELGRPMHAYDLDKLSGGLRVRRAEVGERVTTLDEVARELTTDDLVIADHRRAVGLAGVMGGNDTGVTDATTRVLLECAFFDAVTIRGMAKRHAMHTDASHRFERGLSAEGIDAAVHRACALMHELAGATITGSSLDLRGDIAELRRIELRADRLRGVLGTDVANDEVHRILSGLGFTIETTSDGYAVTVPARRGDVTREVDLIEEIARFHGYDNLPTTLPLLRRSGGGGLQPVLVDETNLRQVAVGLGFWEAITFVFTSQTDQAPFVRPDQGYVELANPLSEAFAVMRRNLAPGLLAAAGRNRSHGERDIGLFEVGRSFAPDPAGGVVERRRLALLAGGDVTAAHWSTPSRPYEFSDMKGIVETIWQRMRWPAIEWAAGDQPGLQAGTAAAVSCLGKPVGFVGKIDPATAAAADIEADVWVAEVDVHDFVGNPAAAVELNDLPRYPASARDISLLVGVDAAYAGIDTALGALADIPLVNHRLLGRFVGDDLPAGTCVWTLRLTYRSGERTLTAEEIESAHDAVVELLVGELDATRR